MTAKRSLAISLAKNSYLFHRLPNDDWGLVSWYENLPPKKPKAEKIPKDEDNGEGDVDDEGKPFKNDFSGEDEVTEADVAAAVEPPKKPKARRERLAEEIAAQSAGDKT